MNDAALAWLLLDEGEGYSALAEVERGTRIAAAVPEAHLALGTARWRAGDREGARAARAEAVRLDPAEAEAVRRRVADRSSDRSGRD